MGYQSRDATDQRFGFTIIELLVVLSIIAVLVSVLIPAIGKARDNALINTSKNNLRQMAVAHRAYAADWAGRHFTLVRDNLGSYGGDVQAYNATVYGGGPDLWRHPVIIAGRGYTSDGRYVPWGSWPSHDVGKTTYQAINFPGPPNHCGFCIGWGWFRFGVNTRPMNLYFNGIFHDPIFYAPKDRVVMNKIEPCFDLPGEVVGGEALGGLGPASCNPGTSNYCLSAAGLFAPEVFADNGNGTFWSAPWEMPGGYRVPSFGQVKYPTLKTHVLEHHWLQNLKVACNGSFLGCEPYYFNHSFQSVPATLFYDGSVRLMGVYEAMSSDRRAQRQTGYGLWSRDTPFGDNGYFISIGYDFAATGYHILTIDGARGRDTVGRE
jgi:prepilin-type N-terminal cleavage/methylation domain-containing protein